MNYTANDTYRNDNNLICIRLTQLAEAYTAEFNKMFEQDIFSVDGRTASPSPSVNINST